MNIKSILISAVVGLSLSTAYAEEMPATAQEMPATAEEMPATAEEMPATGCDAAKASVSRSIVTTAVSNREPVDELQSLTAENQKIYYFTEITGANGSSITHRWSHDGEVQAELNLSIGSNKWRTWSSKNIGHLASGTWQVQTVDENGCVLADESLTY